MREIGFDALGNNQFAIAPHHEFSNKKQFVDIAVKAIGSAIIRVQHTHVDNEDDVISALNRIKRRMPSFYDECKEDTDYFIHENGVCFYLMRDTSK